MQYSAAYFLGNRLLGMSEFQSPGQLHSLACFCATCGEVWGRIAVSGASVWEVDTIPCERHNPTGVVDWSAVPGSFLPSLNRAADLRITLWGRAVEHLPLAVLQREFDITLQWYERKQQDGQDDSAVLPE